MLFRLSPFCYIYTGAEDLLSSNMLPWLRQELIFEISCHATKENSLIFLFVPSIVHKRILSSSNFFNVLHVFRILLRYIPWVLCSKGGFI